MPSFGSGEILGTLKVPNGDRIGRPPPSFKRSGWFGTAWQEEHPPALNVVRPLARSGVRGGSAFDATTAGIVSHQKIPEPAMPAKTTRRRSRRSITDPSFVAFSSEVGTGSRKENASKQKAALQSNSQY